MLQPDTGLTLAWCWLLWCVCSTEVNVILSVGTMKWWGPVSWLFISQCLAQSQTGQLTSGPAGGQPTASLCSNECLKVYTLHNQFDQVSGTQWWHIVPVYVALVTGDRWTGTFNLCCNRLNCIQHLGWQSHSIESCDLCLEALLWWVVALAHNKRRAWLAVQLVALLSCWLGC